MIVIIKNIFKKILPISIYRKLVDLYWWGNGRIFKYNFLPNGYAAFNYIYKENYWESGSGLGSHPDATINYRGILENFITEYSIRSIVDLGCGDWQFSRYVKWGNVNYIGYDVVQDVIEANISQYATPNISFIHLRPEEIGTIKEADLFIAKEVFQHLPNDEIKSILDIALLKYKYLLVTDVISANGYESINDDIKFGYFRCVDITRPPFSFEAKWSKNIDFSTKYGDMKWKVTLICNEQNICEK
ncbi:MAG: class I SAM-dependent methyltransferase [Synergistaceae bacterium]|nr:class I SAM-dependent methyltransferase [Synergistaceae bacterium]